MRSPFPYTIQTARRSVIRPKCELHFLPPVIIFVQELFQSGRLFVFIKKRDDILFKSCSYCGGIHDVAFACPKKPKRKYKQYFSVESVEIRNFRNSVVWQEKREYIKRRDNYMCVACLVGFSGSTKRITTVGLSVHHITPLAVNFDLRLDDNNLITLCKLHHDLAENGVIPAEKLKALVSPRG